MTIPTLTLVEGKCIKCGKSSYVIKTNRLCIKCSGELVVKQIKENAIRQVDAADLEGG